jgi:uncharacterized iron-regulated membrane protein
MLRTLSSKIHLYVGLALAAVLIVLSVTGSALVFRDALEGWLRPDLHEVEPASGDRISPGVALEVVREAAPNHPPRFLHLPQSADAPYKVWLRDAPRRHAYVDPYRGTLLGIQHQDESVMGMIFSLHAELMAGKTGEWIVGVSGLLLVLLCLTGLVLWWPRVGRLRRIFVIAYRYGWRRLNYDLHRAGGFWTLLFVVVVAASGSAMIFYTETGALLNGLTGSTSVPPPPRSAASSASPDVPVDDALATARSALPDGTVSFVYLPSEPRAPITVRMRTPSEWHPNGRSYAYVDRYSGKLLRVDDAREAPLGARLLHKLYPLHIGAVGGVWMRVLYVVLGLAPTVLSISGVLIWYQRWHRQHKAAAASSRDVPARPAVLDASAPVGD